MAAGYVRKPRALKPEPEWKVTKGRLLYRAGDIMRCEAGHAVATILADTYENQMLTRSALRFAPAYAKTPTKLPNHCATCRAPIPWWEGSDHDETQMRLLNDPAKYDNVAG